MASSTIGLDVGTNAVRAVEIELSDPPLIRRMGQVALPNGAVVDGEVADVDAVATALQRLWDQAGFKSRAVRVGMSSARVIVRTVEMPRLSHDELMSTIRLQLDDFVPLPAEDTVFDIREMDGAAGTGQTMQLLLAATHRDAVEPLTMALRDARLNATAIDVIPAALALSLTHPEPDADDSVDVVLSIGAGTLLVVAARGGEPIFARTVTSSCGRLTTDRIASELAIGQSDAERYKRLGATEDPSSSVALLAAQESVEELIDEVRASLAFYADQPAARPVRRMLLTGGGSLLPGLLPAFTETFGLRVEPAQPFTGLRLGETGFEECDLPYLAPYMAGAIGVALGASRPKDRRIDLTPVATRARRSPSSRRLLLVAGAAVLVGTAGALYVQSRSAVADEKAKVTAASAELVDLRAQVEARTAGAPDVASAVAAATPEEVVASVAPVSIDWVAVHAAIADGSEPLGIKISSFQGVLDQAAATGALVPVGVGALTLAATAPTVPAVADWLDALSADARFADPWVGGLTIAPTDDGSKVVQFSITMSVTSENLVDRNLTTEVQP